MAQSDSPQGKGTRAVLISWLAHVKGMTYTKYSKLPTTQKLDIQQEYGKRGQKEVRVAGVSYKAEAELAATKEEIKA